MDIQIIRVFHLLPHIHITYLTYLTAQRLIGVGTCAVVKAACLESRRSRVRQCNFILSHHTQEVLLARSSLNVHKGGLKPHSFYFTA